MDDNKQTPSADDRAARMNKFFEEMNQKINQEATPPKQDFREDLSAFNAKNNPQTPPKQDNYAPNTEKTLPPFEGKPETKQSFLDAMRDLKTELDPLADKMMDNTFSKAQELYGKAEEKAKQIFGQFDKYTDDLEAKLRAKDEEYEAWKSTRPAGNNTGGSLFEGTGGLFGKASEFLKRAEADAKPKSNEPIIENIEKPKRKKLNPDETVYGLNDLDKDGNPYIDDAIIED